MTRDEIVNAIVAHSDWKTDALEAHPALDHFVRLRASVKPLHDPTLRAIYVSSAWEWFLAGWHADKDDDKTRKLSQVLTDLVDRHGPDALAELLVEASRPSVSKLSTSSSYGKEPADCPRHPRRR